MGADLDGDTVALYRVHDYYALEELEKRAYMLHNIRYDHNGDYIQTLELEAIYAANILINNRNTEEFQIEVNSIVEVSDIYDNIKEFDKIVVLLNNKKYKYGTVLLNKWAGFNNIQIKTIQSSNDISKTIHQNSSSDLEFHKRIKELNIKLLWFISVHPKESLTFNMEELINVNTKKYNYILSNLPKNPFIGQYLYESAVDQIYKFIPEEYKLKKLTKIKLRKTQVARMVVAIGYIADEKNIILPEPIKHSLLNGFDYHTFFETASGTRKGIIDKALAVPTSGYLERTMVYNLSPIELTINDCECNIGFNIYINSIEHAFSLLGRYYLKDNDWTLFRLTDINDSIGKTFIFRSPITCQTGDFGICRKCFGEYKINTPYIGILTGQSIAERCTQLTLRSFHTSGSSSIITKPKFIDYLSNNLEEIDNNNEIIIKFKSSIPEDIRTIINDIPGYDKEFINDQSIKFYPLTEQKNEDITKKVIEINELLKTNKHSTLEDVSIVYDKFIMHSLSIGNIYSTFIEIVLCNMFLTNDKEILRHAIKKHGINNIDVGMKLGIRRLHTAVSKLLGLLYEPNLKSINKIKERTKIPFSSNTVFEKLWIESG